MLSRKYGPRAIEVIAGLMEKSPDDRVRLSAAQTLLDRCYGKPVQQVVGPAGSEPNALHLIAAQVIARQVAEERAAEGPPTIEGTVTNTPEARAIDAPPALE